MLVPPLLSVNPAAGVAARAGLVRSGGAALGDLPDAEGRFFLGEVCVISAPESGRRSNGLSDAKGCAATGATGLCPPCSCSASLSLLLCLVMVLFVAKRLLFNMSSYVISDDEARDPDAVLASCCCCDASSRSISVLKSSICHD